MAADTGSAAVALQPCDDKALRRHIESVVGGQKNLTDAQMVDLLIEFLPQTYPYHNRKLLIERVAKIARLPWRRAVAIDEPAPATKKRRKIDEAPIVNRQNVVSSSSVSDESSDSGGNSNGEISGDLGRSDELGDGRREIVKINGDVRGDLGGRDVNRSNLAKLGDLEGSDGKREKHNRPMFRDFFGMDEVIHDLRRELVSPLRQWKLLRHLGVEPVARVLLHGPPGCGKTRLARAIANEARLPLFEISAARLVTRVSAEENIRELFSTAYMRAPSVVFIDDLEVMTSKMGSLLKDIEPHIVNMLMACMDNAGSEGSNSRPGYVLVIGATSCPDALDPALRQQFDREFSLDVLDCDERLDLLSALTCNLKVEVGFDLPNIAECTMGYVAGDLIALVKNAGILAANRIMNKRNRILDCYKEHRVGVQLEDCSTHTFHNDKLEHLSITMADFVGAAKMVRPSTKMDLFSTTPNVKWDDVGGLQSLKLEFECLIVKQIKYPEVYRDLRKPFRNSFFLCGPSGCGKTLIVEALAKEAGASFMHIEARDLLRYGDQAELVVHNIFRVASIHHPCVVFFDKLDLLTPCDDGERWPDFRKLISVFNEIEVCKGGIFFIAATNRPEIVSHSSLINREFDRILYVPLPSPEERGAILKALARRKPVDADVDLMALGKDAACENFSGSDLSALMTEASKFAFDRPLSHEGRMTIRDEDFKRALAKISPSLSSTEIKNWELQSKKIAVHSSPVMDW